MDIWQFVREPLGIIGSLVEKLVAAGLMSPLVTPVDEVLPPVNVPAFGAKVPQLA